VESGKQDQGLNVLLKKMTNDSKRLMRVGLFFLCSLLPVVAGAEGSRTAGHVGHTGEELTFCARERMEREHEIFRNTNIEIEGELHEQSASSCFEPRENLYFTALVVAEEKLGALVPWSREASSALSRQRAHEACKVLGYEESRLAMDQCQRERYAELMQMHEWKHQEEAISHINTRNEDAERLMQGCVLALAQNLERLPKSIVLPLAYYDRRLRTYPAWYVEERVNDKDWLENMQSTSAYQVLEDALGDDCPGDMIWWLY